MSTRFGFSKALRRSIAGCAALLSIAGGMGCDSEASNAAPKVEKHPVSGKVTLADGKPLTKGRIVLVPQSEGAAAASGEIGPDGAFQLSSVTAGDGAAAGTYRAWIDWDQAGSIGKGGKLDLPFPKKFANEDTSKLTVTIDANTADLPITLK